jgi:hypothetical protein
VLSLKVNSLHVRKPEVASLLFERQRHISVRPEATAGISLAGLAAVIRRMISQILLGLGFDIEAKLGQTPCLVGSMARVAPLAPHAPR